MDAPAFRRHGHDLIDWIADYLETNEELPVMSRCEPGAVAATLPDRAPEEGEDMGTILEDFRRDILELNLLMNHLENTCAQTLFHSVFAPTLP